VLHSLTEDDFRIVFVGPTAIVGARLRSLVDTNESVHVLLLNSYFFSAYDDLTFTNFPDGTGFVAQRGAAQLFFYSKNHPLVVNADSYWFGDGDDAQTHRYDQVTDATWTMVYPVMSAGFTSSWLSVPIPARGDAFISFVFSFGPESSPPGLDMSATTIPAEVLLDEIVTLTGTVSDSDGDPSISVFAVPDGHAVLMVQIATELSASEPEFTRETSAADLGLVRGAHLLQFYAIDSTGTIGRIPVNFSVTVNAATETPTDSPTVSESLSISEMPAETPLSSPTPDRSATPRPSPTIARSPRETQTPRPTVTREASLTAGQSPTATRTPSPTVPPIRVNVSGDFPIQPVSDVVVVLSGSGTIRSRTDDPLELSDLMLEPGAQIVADGLRVDGSLVLLGGSSLQPTENGKITLENWVSIGLQAEGVSLPTVDLGRVGEEYSVVPSSLVITGLGGLEPAAVGERKLIAGRTLSNCEDWKERVLIDSPAFTTECRTTAEGARILDNAPLPEIGLFLVAASKPGSTSDDAANEEDNDNTGMIVGIVVGVVVVLAAVGAVVFFVMKRATDGSSGGAAPKDSYL
jgi:hypothetical protein